VAAYSAPIETPDRSKEPTMNSPLRTQIAAFSLAAFATFGLMASINGLASAPAPADSLAGTSGQPAQVVVVTGKRITG
jgi:hypothetical protein